MSEGKEEEINIDYKNPTVIIVLFILGMIIISMIIVISYKEHNTTRYDRFNAYLQSDRIIMRGKMIHENMTWKEIREEYNHYSGYAGPIVNGMLDYVCDGGNQP